MAALTKNIGLLRTLKVHNVLCHDISGPLTNTFSLFPQTISTQNRHMFSFQTTKSNRFHSQFGVICPVDFGADVNSVVGIPQHCPSLFLPTARPYATQEHQKCWKCGKEIDSKKEQFFCDCGLIQPPQEWRTYFEVMGISEGFDVDTDMLQKRFRDLQWALHPDKFSRNSKEEQEYSREQSTLVNQAYRTLQKPYTRGLYMLQLNGEALDEGQIEMDPVFLTNIMELNEQILDTDSDECLRQVKKDMSDKISELNAKISNAFNDYDFPLAKQLLAQIKYYANIEEKVDGMLESDQSSDKSK